jgi:hypothetical protein
MARAHAGGSSKVVAALRSRLHGSPSRPPVSPPPFRVCVKRARLTEGERAGAGRVCGLRQHTGMMSSPASFSSASQSATAFAGRFRLGRALKALGNWAKSARVWRQATRGSTPGMASNPWSAASCRLSLRRLSSCVCVCVCVVCVYKFCVCVCCVCVCCVCVCVCACVCFKVSRVI